jgi:RHS repeat-associated protein
MRDVARTAVSFVGRSEIGDLMALGERIYDPAVGRFLSPDPIYQLTNQYTYTMGNPVWYIDPDGRNSTETGAKGGGARGKIYIEGGSDGWKAGAEVEFPINLPSCGLGAGQALPFVWLWFWYARRRRRAFV